MGEFLTGKRLKNKILDIIDSAEKKLILVSPYITLHDYYKLKLVNKTGDSQLVTSLIYQKERARKKPNLSQQDFEFFKIFKKVSIYANHRLHAKLYANENGILLTSMNLYKFSQDNNNIEFGVYYPANNSLKNRQDLYIRTDIQQTLQNIIVKSTLEYTNIPTIQHDLFTAYYAAKAADRINNMSFPPEEGYCIRTGAAIPFNIKKPYSAKAYKDWSKEGSLVKYEPFCHLTGERTGEPITLVKPIAYSNWVLLRKKFPNFVTQLIEKHSLTP
jgi:hypothetical protein